MRFDLLTPEEAAHLLDISIIELQQAVSIDLIKPIQLGKIIRFSPDDVNFLMDAFDIPRRR